MDNEIKIPNGCIASKAEYKNQIITDYKGNPFIEALPPLYQKDEIIEQLASYPDYHANERKLDKQYRIHMINRIFNVFQPLPLSIELEGRISRILRQGYIFRNPFGRGLVKGFQDDYENLVYNNKSNKTSSNQNISSGFTLIGISGLGKTTSLNRVLNAYSEVISHSAYFGNPISTYQIVWMKLECPFDGSVKALMYNFFSKVDELLGPNYYVRMTKTRATTDVMLTVMNQVVRNINLGILIIDEIQHLNNAKSGGSQKVLSFFVNLVNTVGVPMVMVGTPKAMSVLQTEFRQARRGIGIGGNMICDRLTKNRVWDLLIQTIWKYQWTINEVQLTEDISNALYEETQGIPDLLTKLYAIVQVNAITLGTETITPAVI